MKNFMIAVFCAMMATFAGAAETDEAIAKAKTEDMVWVSTGSKVYHTKTAKLFGKTLKGNFVKLEDAKAQGLREARKAS